MAEWSLWHRQFSNTVFFELQGGWRCVPTPSIQWLDCLLSYLYLTPFYRFMALSLLILIIKCIFGGPITLTQWETLCMLVSLSMVIMSVSGMHNLSNSFTHFQCSWWVELPSHLFWLITPLATDASLFDINTETSYFPLMSYQPLYAWIMGKGYKYTTIVFLWDETKSVYYSHYTGLMDEHWHSTSMWSMFQMNRWIGKAGQIHGELAALSEPLVVPLKLCFCFGEFNHPDHCTIMP